MQDSDSIILLKQYICEITGLTVNPKARQQARRAWDEVKSSLDTALLKVATGQSSSRGRHRDNLLDDDDAVHNAIDKWIEEKKIPSKNINSAYRIALTRYRQLRSNPRNSEDYSIRKSIQALDANYGTLKKE